MRVRVTLLPPFLPAKILLPVPENVETISELKKLIHRSLSSVSNVVDSSRELKLSLDGFELLGGSGVDLIQLEDVVEISLKAGSSRLSSRPSSVVEPSQFAGIDGHASHLPSSKRRAVSLGTSLRSKKTADPSQRAASMAANVIAAPTIPPQPIISSSSISSSSISSISSPSSSSSASDEDSTESSSETDTLSGDEPGPSGTAYPSNIKPQNMNLVPPGEGKASTRDRNARRRIARRYKREIAESHDDYPEEYPATNGGLMPNGHSGSDMPCFDGQSSNTSPAFVPIGVSNRNKKKGFLKEMMQVRGTKTVFELDTAQSTQTFELEHGSTAQPVDIDTVPSPNNPTKRPKWIAPSDLESLPDNVFVTSMEFRRPDRTRQPQTDHRAISQSGVTAPLNQTNGHINQEDALTFESAEKLDDVSQFFEDLEERFDNLPSVRQWSDITRGTCITWKEVELDMSTFSPQLKVQLATVMSAGEDEVTISVHRAGMDGEAGEEVERTVTRGEIATDQGQYRIVPSEVIHIPLNILPVS